MKYQKQQVIKIKIEQAGQSVKFSADTDKQYQKVKGIFVSLPYPPSFFGTTLELKIANDEIFSEDHEAKMLSCSEDVSPNQRYVMLDDQCDFIEGGGSLVEGKLTDGGQISGVTFPYIAKLYLLLSNEKKH